jgi:hypothetical protein
MAIKSLPAACGRTRPMAHRVASCSSEKFTNCHTTGKPPHSGHRREGENHLNVKSNGLSEHAAARKPS